MKVPLQININGEDHEILVDPWRTLLEVLRDELGLTGTKEACNTGNCGACTVILNGKAVKSCLILALQAGGAQVTTIEGLADEDRLHPIQQAFIDEFAVQCGFCTPGMIMSAKALLDENPNASEAEIRAALHGNLCRCTGYTKIARAVMTARDRVDGRT
ncbi:MAG: (2Fe-2S)-binding protein [Chloroflexi bacterium]|nr:(2Fe-2S)-binding protein [Chloroflexota bacterium]